MLFEYPLIECKKSKSIDEIFVSTDSEIIKKNSKNMVLNLLKDQKN